MEGGNKEGIKTDGENEERKKRRIQGKTGNKLGIKEMGNRKRGRREGKME